SSPETCFAVPGPRRGPPTGIRITAYCDATPSTRPGLFPPARELFRLRPRAEAYNDLHGFTAARSWRETCGWTSRRILVLHARPLRRDRADHPGASHARPERRCRQPGGAHGRRADRPPRSRRLRQRYRPLPGTDRDRRQARRTREPRGTRASVPALLHGGARRLDRRPRAPGLDAPQRPWRTAG